MFIFFKKNVKKAATYRAPSAKATLLKICFSMALFVFFVPLSLVAQQKSEPEYNVKAAFLCNFTRFIYWPSTAFVSHDDPFVIGIIGKDPFGPRLDELVKKEKVGERPIVIKRFKDNSDLQASHILYINISEPAQLKDILAKIDPLHTLTVSDISGFTSQGGQVVFYSENNKIKIGINTEATKKSLLEISSKLLSIAKDMANKEL